MNKYFWVIIGICLGIPSTPILAANVLSNPGFEFDGQGQSQNLPGWTIFGANAYTETGPLAHSGTNYFKVYQAFNGVVNDTGIYQDYISGPGAVYAANGWAYTSASDTIAGQNVAWIEVTFRDASANVLALYRSAMITTNTVASGAFRANTWINLPVTNQYNPSTLQFANGVSQLVAPAGTYFVRYQIVFQGDANYSAGSMYFDDLDLSPTGGAAYGNWNIVWSDEFNESSLNPNTWTYDIGNGSGGWGNNELEYYTSSPDNAYVASGYLHIVALKQSDGGENYTSARILSQGLFSFLYGRIEWRAQLPNGAGFWPALWLLGANINNVGWPECGEVDVMENNGSALGTVQGSLHSGSDETAVYNFLNGDSVTNFHTYTLDWGTNAMLFYVDGHLYESQTNWSDSAGAYPTPFNQPFFILMNLAVGGNYLGNPSTNTINTSTFPSEMLVDYVRIYSQTAPLQISISHTNSKALLNWPGNIVCHLQSQVENLSTGLGTNWVNVTSATNTLTLQTTNQATFYRLASP
jgi:beta-glucanase (GH16 family)